MSKINIFFDNAAEKLDGYINIDPFATRNSSCLSINPANLDEFFPNCDCEDMKVNFILTGLPPKQIRDILDKWINILKIGGTMSIIDNDFDNICHKYQKGLLDISDVNMIIIGDKLRRQNLLSMRIVEDFLLDTKRVKILEKYFDGYNFVIKVERKI